MDLDTGNLLILGLTFLLAGTVKGIIGLGLPTISLAILAIVFDLTTAMALLLVPSFLTNLWQAMAGGKPGLLIRQLWPMFLTATITVWLGALALTRLNLSWLSALLGLLLIIYSLFSLFGVQWRISSKNKTSFGLLIGIVNGVLTGMTGSFVVPGVMYLQAIGLSRDQLIQSMGILFTLSTLSLAVALQSNSLLNFQLGIYSALAVAPALIGMILGQRIRQLLSENLFRRVFFIALLLLGIYILTGSV
jgi:uncharacterized membrane protein YfcA